MKSFNQLMANSSGVLRQLWQHSQTLKRLDKMLQASLSAPLKQHCHVANFRQQMLIVHTDSSSWANRLRYMVPDLVRQWQQRGVKPTIVQIKVRVRPSNTVSRSRAKEKIEPVYN